MNKSKLFETEINYIKKLKYKENLKTMIDLLPDYFFEIPASSTGKYHPAFSLGHGGLLRHTKVAAKIAYEFYQNESITDIFNDDEKDLMMFSIILHDGLKSGLAKSEYTLIDHPLLISNFIKENKEKLTLTDSEILFVTSSIETHMGPWVNDYQGNKVLNKPKNKYQKFVHMCDYIASRKFLDVKFDKNEIIN
ncbi:MAG: hypothetical protein PHN42_01020 [Bacilli bacterium]|nr:hypothetical protein [Bacilli bacterium]